MVNFPVMLTGKEYKMVLLQRHLSGTHSKSDFKLSPELMGRGTWIKWIPERNCLPETMDDHTINSSVKNLVNSADQRCKGIAGNAVTKLDFYYHMTVIDGNNKLILRSNPVWNNNSSCRAASGLWFDWVEVNWFAKDLSYVIPAILCLLGEVTYSDGTQELLASLQ